MQYVIGIVIAFFLFFLLLGKKGKTTADMLLVCLLLWVGGHIGLYYLYKSEAIYQYPMLLGLSLPMPLFYPPWLYVYTFALCHERLPRFWYLHFIPFFAAYGYLLPFLAQSDEYKIYVFQHRGEGHETFLLLLNITINITGVLYPFLAYRLLQKHRKTIATLFSFQENINLQWLQNMIFGIGGIWVAVLADRDDLVFDGAVLLVLFIGFFGIRQVGIFATHPGTREASDELERLEEAQDPIAQNETERKKYEKSGLNPETADTLYLQLQGLMQEEELYRDGELSLTDLAGRLNTHPNYLSQIINEKEGKNFYDYVNFMRVQAFLAMLARPENRRYTLLAMAYDCGFNSKSAFNRYFRKITGMAPSEYFQENFADADSKPEV